jgi:monoterpene epsilon-lactone hydrolase
MLAAAIAKPYRTPAWNANPPDAAGWTNLVNQLAALATAVQPGWRERLGVTMTTSVTAAVSVFILEPKEMPSENRNRDAMAVYKALLTTTDPAHIAMFGTSTGGGMTLALMLRAN